MTTDPRRARPRERIPASLRSGTLPTNAVPIRPSVPDRASDRTRPPSPGPVAGGAPVRSGHPSAASPGARRTTHAADASRRFVASVSVIATLVMVGAMARSAAAQNATEASATASDANASDANASDANAAGSAGVAAPVATAPPPAPTAITVPPTAVHGPATTIPQRLAPVPAAPAPRATVAPPASKSRAS